MLVQQGEADVVDRLAQRVRAKVRGLALPELGDHRVTVSAGVAAWRTEQADLKGWIAAADIALFAANREGRDQVRHAA